MSNKSQCGGWMGIRAHVWVLNDTEESFWLSVGAWTIPCSVHDSKNCLWHLQRWLQRPGVIGFWRTGEPVRRQGNQISLPVVTTLPPAASRAVASSYSLSGHIWFVATKPMISLLWLPCHGVYQGQANQFFFAIFRTMLLLRSTSS